MSEEFMDHYGYYEQDISVRRVGGKIRVSRESLTGFGLKPAFMRGTLTVYSFSFIEIERGLLRDYVIGLWGVLEYSHKHRQYSDPVVIIIDLGELKKEWWGNLTMYIIYEHPPTTEEAPTLRFWDAIKEILNEVLPWI